MPQRKKTKASETPVEALTHEDKRVNIPTADAADFVADDLMAPVTLRYPRDTDLDPQLVWRGKDQQDSDDLLVTAPPLFIQEKIDPRVLIEDLEHKGRDSWEEQTLFDSFDGLKDWESLEYYRHALNWSNRLILGDSLQVMASLADRENLRGQVQMIYLDPPYGINFGSNWQVSAKNRLVKDRIEDASRDVEQIKAFRDTWELGIHSYLAYLRDRLVVARELLTETGSIFIQIGDENIHLVRNLLDEVFGPQSFCAQISFRTKIPLRTTLIPKVYDHVLWYAKDSSKVKFRRLFKPRPVGSDTQFSWVETPDGTRRKLTRDELDDPETIEGRVFRLTDLVSAGRTESCVFEFEFEGRKFFPSGGKSWKTNPAGMERLIEAGRIMVPANTPSYVFFADDYPVMELDNVWSDTQGASDRSYVVQTSTKVIERCLLMATDPGDLVLDPTCGSGTTAAVAEEWGRRWITVDTSRVAVTVARQRLMSALFPYYQLSDEHNRDVRRGFNYREVPHVTLGAIARNPEIKSGMSRDKLAEVISRFAESEILYNQPHVESNKVRVAGPFTVESLAPHRAVGVQVGIKQPTETGNSFEHMLLENLRTSGVQSGRRGRRFEFESFEPLGGKYLVAEMLPREKPAVRERIAVSIGPRYGTVGSDWIKGAAREALRGEGFDVLLILGFSFDPRAIETVEEFSRDSSEFELQREAKVGGLRILLVRMNADLAMGEDLLRKSKNANLFTVFGEPDVRLAAKDDGWTAEVVGFDVYNPVTGQVTSGNAEDIAMWMIDTDYNEESFFVRAAYFPGRQDPFTKLKRALKADIDEEAWKTLNSSVSRPFPRPASGKVAVKIINDYGDEVMSVLDVPES